MGTDFAGMQDHASFTMDEQTIREKSPRVPLSVVKGMVLNGTVDDVLDQAAEWRDHGVRYIVVVNFGPMVPSLSTGLATLLPFNKVVRGLKRAEKLWRYHGAGQRFRGRLPAADSALQC